MKYILTTLVMFVLIGCDDFGNNAYRARQSTKIYEVRDLDGKLIGYTRYYDKINLRIEVYDIENKTKGLFSGDCWIKEVKDNK